MRIFAISDLHVDFKVNWHWVEALSLIDYRQDTLLVAGDIAHDLGRVAAAFEALRQRFDRVFFVPGNHELWVPGEQGNSIDKFERLLALCVECGVETRANSVGNLRVMPLFSWYSAEFDREGRGDADALAAWGDFRFCRWPDEIESPERYFSERNDPPLPTPAQTISFSHFLPRSELLPSIENLRFKGLPMVAGSVLLEEHIRAAEVDIHIFGHSHIPCDKILEGVRYIQQPLAYPKERRGRPGVLKQVV
ncbi:MAG: 3',5'-cyclic AMP phosphodiesterase CpdA [Candidatus Latescibacterota bacterium]|jgi:3',5'-cyclic AMP phosphodiesterase CpdA